MANASQHLRPDDVLRLPPGWSWPSVTLPEIEPGEPASWGQTDVSLDGAVSHAVALDDSPLQEAWGLLTIRVGSPRAWSPSDAYMLMPLGIAGLAGQEGQAVAVLDGELVVFDGTLDADGKAVRTSVVGSGYTLSWRDGHAVATHAEDRAWHFAPVDLGRHWRLMRIELGSRPGQFVAVQWQDDHIIGLRYPNGESVRYEWTDGRVTAVQTPIGRSAAIEYDGRGLVKGIAVYRSASHGLDVGLLARFSYEHDEEARLSRIVNEHGTSCTVKYNEEIRQPVGDAKASTKNGHIPGTRILTTTIRNTVDNSIQFSRCEIESSGNRSVIQGYAAPRQSVEDALAYFSAHELKPTKNSSGKSEKANIVAKKPAMNAAWVLLTAASDWQLRLHLLQGSGKPGAKQSIPDGRSKIERDAAGRVIARTDAEGAIIKYEYDKGGEIAAAIVGEQRHGFLTDKWGRISEHVQPDGSMTRWQFDDLGHVTTVTKLVVKPKPEASLSTELSYDAMSTQYQYDRWGRLTQITYPNGSTEKLHYDPSGNLTLWVGIADSRIQYQYDALGRLTRQTDPRTGFDIYTYHAAGLIATHAFVKKGQRRVEREYNLAAQMIAETIPGVGRTQFGYDEKGRQNRIVHPDGTDTIYTFDELDRVVSIRGSHQPPSDMAYDNQGRRTVSAPVGAVVPPMKSPSSRGGT